MANNLLYKNTQINYRLLEIWEVEFMLFGIMDSIVHYNTNQYKRKGYVTDLNDGNFGNNFDVAIVSAGIEEDHINSS